MAQGETTTGGARFLHDHTLACPICDSPPLHNAFARTSAKLPPPHRNPIGGDTWYHGTSYQFLPDEDDEHDDPGGRVQAPDRFPMEYGSYANHHWNTDLGVHFTSRPDVARAFATGDASGGTYERTAGLYSRVLHAGLHMANPAHFADEAEMAKAAIGWAHSKGMRFIPSTGDKDEDRTVHEHFINSDYESMDHPEHNYDYLENVGGHDDETRTHISAISRRGVRPQHRLEHVEAYLRLHPQREEITDGWRDHLQSQGHDGITYGNSHEKPGHICAIAFPDTVVHHRRWQWMHDSQQHLNEQQGRGYGGQHVQDPNQHELPLKWSALVKAAAGTTLHRGISVKVNGEDLAEAHEHGGLDAVHQHIVDQITSRKPGLGTHWTSDLAVARKFAGGIHGSLKNQTPKTVVDSYSDVHVPVVLHGRVHPTHHETDSDELAWHMVQGHGWNPLATDPIVEAETLVRSGAPVHITHVEACLPTSPNWLHQVRRSLDSFGEQGDLDGHAHAWRQIGGSAQHTAGIVPIKAYHASTIKDWPRAKGWFHVGSQQAALDRATAVDNEGSHYEPHSGPAKDSRVYVHEVELHGRVYPHVVDDETASDLGNNYGDHDQIEESERKRWGIRTLHEMPAEKLKGDYDLPEAIHGYSIIPYRNDTEDKGSISYLVHHGAIKRVATHDLGPTSYAQHTGSRSDDINALGRSEHPNVDAYLSGGIGHRTGDESRSVVGFLPTALVRTYREHGGDWNGEHSKDAVAAIRADLDSGVGLTTPIQMQYDHDLGWGYVGEGNHRVEAAHQAGTKTVPVRVYGRAHLERQQQQRIGGPMRLNTDFTEQGAGPDYVPPEIHPHHFTYPGGANHVHVAIRRQADTFAYQGQSYSPHEYTHTHPWLPSAKMFAPGKSTLDPRLFDGDTLKAQVRDWVLARIGRIWYPEYHGWQDWARIYLAGSEATYWWGAGQDGDFVNNDLDILIGIDHEDFRARNPEYAQMADVEIDRMLTQEFREKYNDEHAQVPWEPYGNDWHVTAFCNPGSWDIRDIKPYGAYEILSGTWYVRPPEVPADWGPQYWDESTWAYCEATLALVNSIRALPEPERTRRGAMLYDAIHSDRSNAFSVHGTGWTDNANVVMKFLDQEPSEPFAFLVECKRRLAQGLDLTEEPKTASVVDDLGSRPEYDSTLDYDGNRERQRAWSKGVRSALSRGLMSAEQAKASGYHGRGHDDSQHGLTWQPLPHTLYHVTTDADSVRAHGIKSREELAQRDGKGLGGGESDTISFTTDEPLAHHIQDSLHEFHDVLNGRKTARDLVEEARTGTGAARPFLKEMVGSYGDTDWHEGKDFPHGMQAVLDGKVTKWRATHLGQADMEIQHGSGWTPHPASVAIHTKDGPVHTFWHRDATPEEQRENLANLYKHHSAWREYAGGKPDPLFFATDVHGFAKMDPKKFAVLKFHPRPGAQGYPLEGMGEWRTTDGRAVHLAEDLPKTGAASRWMDYDDLPEGAQKALLVTTDTHTPEEVEAGARQGEYQIEHVPTDEVKRRVMQHSPYLREEHGSFENYHRWYLTGGDVPDHGASRWPVIEADADDEDGGYLYDGWHRLHSYVRAGDTHIPVLRARSKTSHKRADRAELRPGARKQAISEPVWFHGTDADFEHFAPQQANKNDWNTALGHHFTSLKDVARGFGGRVISARLAMTRPKHYESEDDLTYEVANQEHQEGHHYPPGHRPRLAEDDWDRPDEDDAHLVDRLLSRNEASPGEFDAQSVGRWLDYHPGKAEIADRHWQRLAAQGYDGITYGNEHEGPREHLCAIVKPEQIEVLDQHLHPGREAHLMDPQAAQAAHARELEMHLVEHHEDLVGRPNADILHRAAHQQAGDAAFGTHDTPRQDSLLAHEHHPLVDPARPRRDRLNAVAGMSDLVHRHAASDGSDGSIEVAGIAVKAEDTGRVLLLQRSNADESDPARGTWEMPGGHLEDGEDPFAGAKREWCEETGADFPEGAPVVANWISGGMYQGFVVMIPTEADLDINLDHDDRKVLNPDDPDGDDMEVAAWWEVEHMQGNPAIRSEVRKGTDWKAIEDAKMPGSAKTKQAQKFAALLKAAEEDYRGHHQAPDADYGAPMHDPSSMLPDVHEHPEYYTSPYQTGSYQSWHALRSVKDKPDKTVMVYRAVPHGAKHINPGDWVTPSREYALLHASSQSCPGCGKNMQVLKARVKARHLHTEGDINEWGYAGPEPVQTWGSYRMSCPKPKEQR